MRHLQAALAEEIRVEMTRQRLTAVEMQRRTGIRPASWSNYWVSVKRDPPFSAVESTCEALGVEPDEMIARARFRADQLDEHTAAAERALAQMSPEAAEQVRQVDREARARRADGGGAAKRSDAS